MAPYMCEPSSQESIPAAANSEPDIRISIDRGGTFCDVLVQVTGSENVIFKLLSVDPKNYRDAATEAIRRTLEMLEKRSISRDEPIDASRISM